LRGGVKFDASAREIVLDVHYFFVPSLLGCDDKLSRKLISEWKIYCAPQVESFSVFRKQGVLSSSTMLFSFIIDVNLFPFSLSLSLPFIKLAF